jgi:hypothetical protein
MRLILTMPNKNLRFNRLLDILQGGPEFPVAWYECCTTDKYQLVALFVPRHSWILHFTHFKLYQKVIKLSSLFLLTWY